jgi:hypothetical protein
MMKKDRRLENLAIVRCRNLRRGPHLPIIADVKQSLERAMQQSDWAEAG